MMWRLERKSLFMSIMLRYITKSATSIVTDFDIELSIFSVG